MNTIKKVNQKKRNTLNMTEIARRVGVARATVYNWEKGQLPSIKHIPELAKVLGVSIEELVMEYANND